MKSGKFLVLSVLALSISTAMSGVASANIEQTESEIDKKIVEVQSFSTIQKNWERKASTKKGQTTYNAKVIKEFEKAEPAFKPEPGKLYFYENIGRDKHPRAPKGKENKNRTSQVVVGDALTKEVITSRPISRKLMGAVHTTVSSPKGDKVYITGGRPRGGEEKKWDKSKDKTKVLLDANLMAPASLLVMDALSLKPLKQVTVGGRIHHAKIFEDQYILFDTFSRDPDGLDVFLYDPETDEVVGGIRDEDLGGASYTAYSHDGYIYILMEPTGYTNNPVTEGYLGANLLYRGDLLSMKPFWIAKVDPKTWTVVKEYPYPGYRGNWIAFDPDDKHMYVPAGGTSNVSKINIETGEIVWAQATGIGPYGAVVTPDGKELWIANKGETAGMFGRTITVIDAETGNLTDTIPSAYQVDHLVLSPTGKEIWATSNGEGEIWVFDWKTHENTKQIPMPKHGGAHGLTFVHYDENGESRTVTDQGGAHMGVDPYKKDKALDL